MAVVVGMDVKARESEVPRIPKRPRTIDGTTLKRGSRKYCLLISR